MRHKVAAIPGSGEELMTWTYSQDLADFVAASLDLPAWKETTYCYGCKMTWNQFVKVADELTGTYSIVHTYLYIDQSARYACAHIFTGSNFHVVYDDVDKLDRGEITELPSHLLEYDYIPKPFLQNMYAQFSKHIIEGCFNLPDEGALQHLVPDVKPKGVREVLSVWSASSL
jgi:hypothetical protein